MRIEFPSPPKKILLIKPSSLGDIIHSLPFLAAVAKKYPKSEIHWVVARGLHKILENHPLIKKMWIINKDKWKKLSYLRHTFSEVCSLYKGLRAERFDVSVDLSGLLRSGLITYAAGARYKLGFVESDEGSPFFYNYKIEGGTDIHAIDRYLKIAACMGCDIRDIEYPMAPLDQNPPIMLELPEKYAVMAPSAGKEANRWPAERFGRLAAKLPIPSVVISGAGDKEVVDQVVAHSNGRAISLAGRTTLTELFAVIGRAGYFISNDTGPMHIAAALSVPVFAIFGPANPDRTGPYGKHTIIREKMECAPCYRWQPCDDWQCMERLTVERVLAEILKKTVSG